MTMNDKNADKREFAMQNSNTVKGLSPWHKLKSWEHVYDLSYQWYVSSRNGLSSGATFTNMD